MIGKIVTGKSFGGAVEYVLKKENAALLACDGVDAEGIRHIIGSFNFQRKSRPEIEKAVKHISLSFHPDDAPRLTDSLMSELAEEYMRRMQIENTQYIIVRHNDTGHPHCHIIFNRVKYDRTLVADKNERFRNVKVCKDLKREYGLTFGEGKEHVKRERLHTAEKTKYAIFDAIKAVLPHCGRMDRLVAELRRKGVKTAFVHRAGDPAKDVQGITFTMNGRTFKGSEIDRKFSYSKIVRELMRNVKQEPTERIPVIFGKRLTDEQVREIRRGEPVYLKGMRHEDRTFDGYLVMDDRLQRGRAYTRDPREWVKFGKYEMRRMDKDLIEARFVTRALVKWWGYGQTARPYLWRGDGKNPDGEPYRESWDDPRMSNEQRKKAEQEREEQRERWRTPVSTEKKRGRGI